jgi:transposase-like protein
VLEGLRGEDSIAELCRKEGINQNLYYRWSKEFLEAGKKRLAGDTAREATPDEVKELKAEARSRGWGGRFMRYSASEKFEIIELVEQSSLSIHRTLAPIGIPEIDVLRLVQPIPGGRDRSTIAARRARAAASTVIEIPWRIRHTRTPREPRESAFGADCQIRSTSSLQKTRLFPEYWLATSLPVAIYHPCTGTRRMNERFIATAAPLCVRHATLVLCWGSSASFRRYSSHATIDGRSISQIASSVGPAKSVGMKHPTIFPPLRSTTCCSLSK